jgi:hypothetical protein
VIYRMTGRWREENWFRYGRAHCALDSLDSHAVTPDEPDRKVPTITASSLSATVQINHLNRVFERYTIPSQPSAPPAPARPRRPHQRIRANRVAAQVNTGGRVLEPRRLCQRLDGALRRWNWPPLSCAGTRSPYASSFTPITSVTR